MRVLVTGHLGYIGTVMVPMLLKAGHDVVGFDSNLYESCTFAAGGTIAKVPHIRKDVRDVQPGRCRWHRRCHSPRGPVERPAGQSQSRSDLQHQPSRQRTCLPSSPRTPE